MPDQRKQLHAALLDAFGSYAEWELLVGLELGVPLARITAPGPLPHVVYEVISYTERRDQTAELVTAARLSNPGNQLLRRLVDEGFLDRARAVRKWQADPDDPVARDLLPHGELLDDWPRQQLETVVNVADGFQNVVPHAIRLLTLADQVCRIEVVGPESSRSGTGFLVGADTVLTNHHVLADVIDGAISPTGVRFQFGFQVRADRTIDHGSTYHLADRWLVAASPPSEVDVMSAPGPKLPSPDELDYAVVRLSAEPGLAAVPGRAERGWIDLTTEPPALRDGMPLLILQHPARNPIKLAQDKGGALTVNGNGTRVTYAVNTLRGSSGSPCFTWDLRLVALHHAGEPEYTAGRNEGVPIHAVIRHLRAVS